MDQSWRLLIAGKRSRVSEGGGWQHGCLGNLKLNEFTKFNYNHTSDPQGHEVVGLSLRPGTCSIQYFISTYSLSFSVSWAGVNVPTFM